LLLVNRKSTYAHLDRLSASPKNDFVKAVVPWREALEE
jgi:hypothetical protein